MQTEQTYTIPGEPRGKGSARGGKVGQRAHLDPATKAYMRRVTKHLTNIRKVATHVGPVEVEIVSVRSRPAYLTPDFSGNLEQPPLGRIACPVKPDADNISKAILDCAKKAGIIADDALVVDLRVRKWWAADGEEPGVVLTIRRHPDRWAAWALARGPRPEGGL